ncbi:uncharacterized protein LOC127081480 [Lathyrus oleraceus]|uniref:uncharacterized protein LOC127081480 n=1 Tax=Pisum sativum TaxID=3888 RepID=UPI0021CFD5E7|nr:uncharacterized protein LOC127081480 [Pisum sativum]
MKTTSANTKKRSSLVKTSSVKCPKSEDSQHFSVTLHHGGEFYRVFEEEIIYRGGKMMIAKAWRAKLIAKKIIEGDADNQYASIWRYAEELRRVNHGNTVKINVERPSPSIQPRFGSFYFCFDGCKKGFIHGCRPFVGVDGCHLKTKYGGQLLIAVGRDANDQYFPLAFGVVENETKESWRWFIQLLMEDIGLVAVFEELSDTIEHRLCLRHLYANFKKRFGGGALIRDLMMGAAKATYYQAWVQKMNELKNADPNAWTWLMAVPTKSWCKHAFSFYPKCDTLMNNISESFNATILAARDKPILTMCEWIRKYLMNRLSTSASKLENWPHKVMPIPRRRLDNEVFRSGHWLPTWSIAETFQVTHSYNTHEFIVDIAKRLCSCNFWELVGIPCRHAVAALSYRKQNPDEFVYACYTREKFALCYGFSVSPINGQDMWPEVEMEPPLPPAYKNGPGRPKKIRIRETGSSVTASITKQSRKRVEKKPIIKRRQSERIKLSWFKRPITGEGISSDKPITLPENEDIPTSK